VQSHSVKWVFLPRAAAFFRVKQLDSRKKKVPHCTHDNMDFTTVAAIEKTPAS